MKTWHIWIMILMQLTIFVILNSISDIDKRLDKIEKQINVPKDETPSEARRHLDSIDKLLKDRIHSNH